jgi:hypothetical protein
MGGYYPPNCDPGNNDSTDQGHLVTELPYMPPGNRHCRASRHWQGMARQGKTAGLGPRGFVPRGFI